MYCVIIVAGIHLGSVHFCLQPEPDQTMPPRKKAKVAQIVSGSQTTAVPTSSASAPALIKSTLSIVEGTYALRHSEEKDIHTSNIGDLAVKDGIYPWPVKHGGTFRDVAQRAWADSDLLVEQSAQLAHRVGLTNSTDAAEFLQEFCKMEALFVISCSPCFRCACQG